jgi:hypothetical protein
LAVWSMDPVATSMPWGSKERHTISILWPFNVWYLYPVFASQILAVRSKEPVTILSLHTNYTHFSLPVGIIEGHCVNDVFVFFEWKQLCSGDGVPHFACSVVAASNEPRELEEMACLTYLQIYWKRN